MFQFKKNNTREEQVFEEVADEQLGQFTGGAGLVTGLTGSLLNTTTNAAGGLLSSINISASPATGSSINAAGIGVTLPGVETLGLI